MAMKTIRTAATALRSTRAAHTHPATGLRASSSEAGPSTPTVTSSSKSSRRLPRPVLRKLVELHHHSTTFLQDPSAFPSGFKVAFNTLHTPVLTPYNAFARGARSLHGRRSLGGLDSLRKAYPNGSGFALGARDQKPQLLQISRSAWTGEQSWLSGRMDMLSEREAMVKEALYGVWARGARRDRGEGAEVGLDGVEEYTEPRGKTVQEDADAWRKRHDTM